MKFKTFLRHPAKPLFDAGHQVEKHVVRPTFRPLDRTIKSLEKRGFVFNAQISTDGQSVNYHGAAEHKHWSIVVQDGDVGVNAHPRIKQLKGINYEVGVGTEGVHADIDKNIEALDGRFGIGIDNDGYYVELEKNGEGKLRLENGKIMAIKSNDNQEPLLLLPPNLPTQDLDDELTDSQAKRHLVYWDDLWNASIDAYPMNPLEWTKQHWNNHGKNEARRECFTLTEEELSTRIKNYALKQLLINNLDLWNETIECGLHPYQLSAPTSPDNMDDQQAKRYLVYWGDLFDVAPSHSRHFNKNQIEWAKLHWSTHGHREPRAVCFDDLEPTLALEITDYHLKSILVNDLELWNNAVNGEENRNPIEYLKAEIIAQNDN